MNQKKGKRGQKIFEEHCLIQRRAKFVKMWKTCEFRDFSVVCVNRYIMIKSLFTGLYGQIIAW